MARTAYTVKTFDKSTGILDHGATDVSLTIDASLVTAGVNVTDAFNTKADSLEIQVYNSDSSAHDLVIGAGDYINSVLGERTITVAAGKTLSIVDIDASRHQKSDGSIDIDFTTGFAGTLKVFAKPMNIS
jgi:hypothetical protein